MKMKKILAVCATICTLFVLAFAIHAAIHINQQSASAVAFWPTPPDGGGNFQTAAAFWPTPPDGGGNLQFWPTPPDGGGNLV